MKPKEKLIKNFTSSKFQILLFVVLVLAVGFFWSLATKQGWEIVVGIGGLMVTGAGYYFKKKTDQNIGLERAELERTMGINYLRQTQP